MNKIKNIFFKILTKHFKYNKLVYKMSLKKKLFLLVLTGLSVKIFVRNIKINLIF